MKSSENLLKHLKNSNEKYVSGEKLAEELNLSRTAVWKQLQALKREGYIIESKPKMGYRLIRSPDLLLPAEVKSGLKTEFIGHRIFYFKETTSTQEMAKKLAVSGEEEGVIVFAEKQICGRGRVGREWISPFGGIWMSIILRPPILPQHAQRITLVTAVAVAKAIKNLYGLDARIKWPNDVLLGDRKVCGILVEASGELERINFLVVGIGVNVNNDLSTLNLKDRKTAVSIREALGRKVSRVDFVQCFLLEFENLYRYFTQNQFAEILKEWRSLSDTLNALVEVAAPGETFEGLALDVDDDGFLIVKMQDGSLRKVLAGDVHVRKPGGIKRRRIS